MTISAEAVEAYMQSLEEKLERKNRQSAFSRLFNHKAVKVAGDILGRAGITLGIKTLAITTAVSTGVVSAAAVTGSAGVSIPVIALSSAASAAGAASWSYIKDTYKGNKEGRRARAWKAAKSGAIGGAIGGWLGQTETFRAGMGLAKEYGGKAAGWLASSFNKFSLIGVAHAAESTAASAAPSAGLCDIVTTSPDSYVPPALPKTAAQDALDQLSATLKTMPHQSSAVKAMLLRGNPADPSSVSAQEMKDWAHTILRENLPWNEKVALAGKLAGGAAEEAKARGNTAALRQAASFARDLAQLKADPFAAQAPQMTDAQVLKEITRIEKDILAALRDSHAVYPVINHDVPLPEGPLPHALRAPSVPAASFPALPAAASFEAVLPRPLTSELSLDRHFSTAAACFVSGPNAEGAFDTTCEIFKPVIQPSDSVACVAQGHPEIHDVIRLTPDSARDIPTAGFLQLDAAKRPVLDDCVRSLAPALERKAGFARIAVSSLTR